MKDNMKEETKDEKKNETKPRKDRIKDSELHLNHRERLRQRYLDEGGISSFKEHQVLEMLLFYCYPRIDTNDIAHRMINEYNGMANLINADPLDIMNRCKVTLSTAILINMIPELARLYFKLQFQEKANLHSTREIGEYAKSLLAGKRNECFFCICLDVKRRVIASSLISEGSVSQTEVYPRKIAECAFKYNAAGIILAHNHPSSAVLPSEADITTTNTIKQVMDYLDIEVVDHIIVGGDQYFSFAAHKRI